MKPIVFATSIVCVFQVTASLAQQSQPNAPAHNVYVLSGCLEGSAAPTSLFTLVDAMAIGQVPPTDPSKTDAGAVAARAYDLLPVTSVGEQGVNRETLASHVGAKVEVTVRPAEPSTDTSTTTRTSQNTAAKVEQSTSLRYTVVKIGKVPGSCG
jgi:hypothetical protein